MWIWRLALAVTGAACFVNEPIVPSRSNSARPPLRVLVVGGGPSKKYNQVGIESNVRYMERLLPVSARPRILFADGDPNSETVLYVDENNKERLRKPKITQIDGPSVMTSVTSEFTKLGEDLKNAPKAATLLYFTGHGSPDRQGSYENNAYDLWDGSELTVQELSGKLDAIPKTTPTVLVMVECFSGGFGNLIFDKGKPDGELTGRRLCGFFASVPQRMSAGCTPTTDESEYHDFTGYFFGALTGTDRVGRKITGVDFDGNGKVGMNEAFAYCLVHDESIDTPTCTSETFLRRFVTTPDGQIFSNTYADVLKWASPAQKAALTALAERLKLSGDDVLRTAYDQFRRGNQDSEDDRYVHLIRFVRLAKTVVLTRELRQHGEKSVKKAFEALLSDEAGNPLTP